MIIGAKPNIYSKAIELVCYGSPIGCVLVERKAQHRGLWEQQQHRTSLKCRNVEMLPTSRLNKKKKKTLIGKSGMLYICVVDFLVVMLGDSSDITLAFEDAQVI